MNCFPHIHAFVISFTCVGMNVADEVPPVDEFLATYLACILSFTSVVGEASSPGELFSTFQILKLSFFFPS